MRKKIIKIYGHNLHAVKVSLQNGRQTGSRFFHMAFKGIFNACFITGLGLWRIISAVGKAAGFVCYYIGSMIFFSASSLFNTAIKDYGHTRQAALKRWRLFYSKPFFQAVVTFVVLAGVSSGIFLGIRLAAKGLEVKDSIISQTFLGRHYLTQAKQAAQNYNLEEAQNKFRQAYLSFDQGEKRLIGAAGGLSGLFELIPKAKDAQKILESSKLVTEAGAIAIDFYNKTSSLKISTAGLESPSGNAATLNDFAATLNKISLNLNTARQKLGGIDPAGIPAAQREEFIRLSGQITLLSQAFNNTRQVFGILTGLVKGDKRLLFIFENNNELRATGGFIGTYGLAKVKDGKITELKVSSIYDLDGQLKEEIMPPRPILNVNGRWYMRDANWFADFPKSAEKLSHFYEKVGGTTPDAVIAVTPAFIKDLLKITGPVNMPLYGVTLDSENFVEVTQVSSSGVNQGPLNQPKQILADFIPMLLQQLEKTDSRWPAVFEALQKNLVEKQMAIYSREPAIQALLESFKWTGSLQPTDRDFLALVSSNLGGTKTDLYLSQALNLDVNISQDGEVINNLQYTRINTMPNLENTVNTSFLRFYVPAGSELISNLGFDYKSLEPGPEQEKYKIDQDVFETESRTLKDLVSGTVIGRESGKTYFGNWLSVKGGESKTVKLTYRLPFRLKSIDRYSLLLQKQLGSLNYPVRLTVSFKGRSVQWKNFDADDMQSASLREELTFNKDYLLGLVLLKDN